MGRVFTPEQVAMGHVPTPEAHLKAAHFFLGEVVERGLVLDEAYRSIGEPVLRGVVVYGSVNHGSQNMRSDFDVFGKYAHTVDSPSTELTMLLQEIDSRFHVGQEPNIWPAEVPLNPFDSTLDKSMLLHLKKLDFKKWGAGSNPTDEISTEDLIPDFADMWDFLRAKINSFNKSFHSSEVKPDGLQRAMESPRSLGRKLLQVLESQGLTEGRIHESDTPEINARLLRLFETDENITEVIKSILTIDSEYTKILSYTVNHQNGSLDEYRRYYEELLKSSVHPDGVMHLANQLVLMIRRKVIEYEQGRSNMHDDLMQRVGTDLST